MFKLNFFMRKRADLSLEGFSTYWRESHGPYAMQGRTSALGMRRYVQNHLTRTPLDAALRQSLGAQASPYEGICQLWFESEQAVLSSRSSEKGTSATSELAQDELNFIDLPQSGIRFFQENILHGGDAASGSHKLILAYVRQGRHGGDQRAAISRQLQQRNPADFGICRVVENVGLETPANERLRAPRGNDKSTFDYVLEIWFRDYASLSPDGGNTLLKELHDHASVGADAKQTSLWLVQERVMISGAGGHAMAA